MKQSFPEEKECSVQPVGANDPNTYLPNYNEIWATFIEKWRGIG